MKDKLKLILLIIPLIFITGCDIEYNLRIDSNQKVKESATITESNEILSIYNPSLKVVPEQTFYQYESLDAFKYYKLDKKIFNSDSTGAKITGTFNSISEYKKSLLLGNLFENISVNEYGNVLSVVASGYNSGFFSSEEDETFSIGEIKVNIKFHNEVTSNNADSINEEDNTYTWILTANEEKTITFTIDKNEKRYDIIIKDLFLDNLVGLIITGIVIVTGLIVAMIFIRKNKQNNKI